MKTRNAGYLREDDLRALGVGAVGKNVRVHETCVLVALEAMRFGDNVRVDTFTVLSAAGGWLTIGDFVHISAHCTVFASAGVEFGDFSGLSAQVSIFSRSDDYTGRYLTNPTVPSAYTNPPSDGPVRLGRHVIVGAGAVILPQVEIGEGAAVGAQALVTRSLRPWTIYAGAPVKVVRSRRKDILDHEIRLRAALESGAAVSPVAGL